MGKISSLGSSIAVCAVIMVGVAFAQSRSSDTAEARATNRRTASFLWQLGDAPSPIVDQTRAVRSCEELSALRPMTNAIVREARVVSGEEGAADWCKVTVQVTRPPAPNVTTVWIGLPLENWNGRFLGLGGGGFQAGGSSSLIFASALGFAAASTDAGHALDSPTGEFTAATATDGSFALDAQGRLDWTAVRNFAHVGIHDMTVVGKALTSEFYGVSPRHSYFSGCSTGGRQGQSEVQRYPEDYDGVLSGAPSVNWTHVLPTGLWPQVVMNNLHAVPQCKFEAARLAAIAACDGVDGIEDGLIDQPNACIFDPQTLVGTQTDCGVINGQDAEVIRQIWGGPRRADGSRLWYGLSHDATFGFTATTGGTPLQGQPNPMFESWPKYFLRQDPNWSAAHLSSAEFELLFDQSVEQYGDVFGTSLPDLGAFADRGGRTIIWHGAADDIVLAQGSIQYVDSIRHELGSARTNQFLRFYLAPGVGHCAGGDGPQPVALLNTLMNWVERDQEPGPVIAENRNEDGQVTRTRPLCPYPQRARYRGRGSIDDADNFVCRR